MRTHPHTRETTVDTNIFINTYRLPKTHPTLTHTHTQIRALLEGQKESGFGKPGQRVCFPRHSLDTAASITNPDLSPVAKLKNKNEKKKRKNRKREREIRMLSRGFGSVCAAVCGGGRAGANGFRSRGRT